MAWWRPSADIRSISIAMAVTAVHAVLAAILLSQKLEPMESPTPEILDIELAELAELAPDIEPRPEPVTPEPDPEPVTSDETSLAVRSPPEPSATAPRTSSWVCQYGAYRSAI